MTHLPYRLLGVVVDLTEMQPWLTSPLGTWLMDPLHLAMRALVAAFAQHPGTTDQQGWLLVKSRGDVEDARLLAEAVVYIHRYDLKRIREIYFATKWNHGDHEQTSYGGLEIADLCAYPLRRSRATPGY